MKRFMLKNEEALYREVLSNLYMGMFRWQEHSNQSDVSKRMIQDAIAGNKDFGDKKLEELMTARGFSKEQIEDNLWLNQMAKSTLQIPLKSEPSSQFQREFEHLHEQGVLSGKAHDVKRANTLTSDVGERILREITPLRDNIDEILDFVCFNLYVYEAHGAVNRHSLALVRARIAMAELEHLVSMRDDFTIFARHPKSNPYVRELYVQARLAEIIAMRNLRVHHTRKHTAPFRHPPIYKLQILKDLILKNKLGELMNRDVWLLHIYRDEIREMQTQRGFSLGQIEKNVRDSNKIFEKNSKLYEDGTLYYMLKQAEISQYLKYNDGTLHGIRLAKGAAADISMDTVDTLPIGLLHKVSLLRALALLSAKINSLDDASYALYTAHKITQAAGLSHQSEQVFRDAANIGIRLLDGQPQFLAAS